MNIGDKVRMLYGKEEGVITAIKGDIIEVAIEDGFSIPVMKREIVIISPEEAKIFGTKNQANQTNQANQKETSESIKSALTNANFAQKGIFLAFLPINDQKLVLYLINNTDWDLPFVVAKERNQNTTGLASGALKARNTIIIDEPTLKDFEQWDVYIFQMMYFRQGYFNLKTPINKKVRFRASNFFKSLQIAPILGKEAYTFQLDKDEKLTELILTETQNIAPNTPETGKISDKILDKKEEKTSENSATKPIDITEIKEKMFEKNNFQTVVNEVVMDFSVPKYEIDLHIEILTSDYDLMRKEEILAYQLDVFEKKLENALAAGMSEIIFIHGIGNGILKSEIHKRASKHPNISFYEEAQKSKFGYGATFIKFK